MAKVNTDSIGPVAVLGGGAMGRAIVGRCIDFQVFDRATTFVAEPDPAKFSHFHDYGIVPLPTAIEAIIAADAAADGAADGRLAVWLLAVKPQAFAGLAAELRSSGVSAEGRTVLSIMAGVTARGVADALGCGTLGVVRTMPNLGAVTGAGVTAIAHDSGASEGAMEVAERVVGCLGPCVERVPEALLDAFTAVSGSGPAYVFYLAEAMIASAIDLGFPADLADRVVRATIAGAGSMLSQSESSPRQLRASVTSKGGTTQAATESLDGAGVKEAMGRAIAAGAARAAELSGLSR